MVEAEFQNLRNISFIEIAFSIAAWKVFVDEQMGDICSSADVKTVFIHINTSVQLKVFEYQLVRNINV